MNETALFQAARQLAAHERAAYLDQTCGTNMKMRQVIEAQLAAHEKDDFLEKPALVQTAGYQRDSGKETDQQASLLGKLSRAIFKLLCRANDETKRLSGGPYL